MSGCHRVYQEVGVKTVIGFTEGGETVIRLMGMVRRQLTTL